MEISDRWLAPDKLEHLLACFLITVLVAAVLGRSRYPYIRRWSLTLGVLSSLAAGAAKEAGDEVGMWESAGGSPKDAVADVAGVLLGCGVVVLLKRRQLSANGADPDRGLSMV